MTFPKNGPLSNVAGSICVFNDANILNKIRSTFTGVYFTYTGYYNQMGNERNYIEDDVSFANVVPGSSTWGWMQAGWNVGYNRVEAPGAITNYSYTSAKYAFGKWTTGELGQWNKNGTANSKLMNGFVLTMSQYSSVREHRIDSLEIHFYK